MDGSGDSGEDEAETDDTDLGTPVDSGGEMRKINSVTNCDSDFSSCYF